MKTAMIFLGLLILLGGCTTYPQTYAPAATTYGTTTTYVVPSTAYYVPTTVYVPSTTYVPSASPAYFYSSQAECARARGLWYPASGLCQLRP